MRDHRKTREYFDSYLRYQNMRIQKKKSKLNNCNDKDSVQRILLSLTGYYMDLIKAEFSAGASAQHLRETLIQALDVIQEYSNITYEDLLQLLSLSIMLNTKENAIPLIQKNEDTVANDRLLNCLSIFIKSNRVEWNEELCLLDEYSLLDDVFHSPNKQDAMEKYLASWYSKHQQSGLYDSHLTDTDTYSGYWSFESAALTIMLEINSDQLQTNKFYPQI